MRDENAISGEGLVGAGCIHRSVGAAYTTYSILRSVIWTQSNPSLGKNLP